MSPIIFFQYNYHGVVHQIDKAKGFMFTYKYFWLQSHRVEHDVSVCVQCEVISL